MVDEGESSRVERFGRLERLYHSALELTAAECEAFLDQACADDDALRREVEALLATQPQAKDFLSVPAIEREAHHRTVQLDTQTSNDSQPVTPPASLIGRAINQYEIVGLLGRGGMGEVWLAEDTRLKRKVALKLLPEEFTNDADRVRRFEQEAHAVSALNHPNIITLFDFGHAEEGYFITTEFVDGQTLRARLCEGTRVSVGEAIEIVLQICSALAAAHEAGIIHRDIKPENVMVRRDKYVKVLDFGLARMTKPSTPAAVSQAATLIKHSTASGVLMGTASYMSPEQARGYKMDARTDIFSLGVVLYEMLAGCPPFDGVTASDVLAAILRSDPPPLADLPAELQRIVSQALVKDRELRYQTIEDLTLDLKNLAAELEFKVRLAGAGPAVSPHPQVDEDLGGATTADRAQLSRLADATPSSLANKIRAVQPAVGERKIVTALFADFSIFSASGRTLDPEDLPAIINQALDRLSPTIFHYEGAVAQVLGNSLLAFFGAPLAHEDDAVRAVRAALEMAAHARQFADELRCQQGVEFEIRLGLNTGPIVIGHGASQLKFEFTAVGDTVNLATRAQAAAPAMAVMVTEDTQRLIATVFDCAELTGLGVKGRTGEVRIAEVRQSRTELDRVHGLAGLQSRMVGREAELTALLQLSRAAQAGLGRVAVIIGEPGLGKTRLLTEWKKAAEEENLQWAEGHCLSYGQGLAYHLLQSLVRGLLGAPAAAEETQTRAALLKLTEELLGEAALDVYSYLGHLLALKLEGEALERVRQLDPQALQNQYLMSLRRLLTALAARRPLGLMLEDIHWADPSSVELLKKLLPLASEAPLLFCFVTRPERDTPGWRLVNAARDLLGRRLAELTLRELSEADSALLIANLLDNAALPEATRKLILSKAEGNPFFVEEVIRMLIEHGALAQRDGQWIAQGEIAASEIPDNLQSLLLARIDRLPEDAKRVLRVASVIGRQFSVKVLEQVMTLLDQLNTLESSGLIQLAAARPELEYLFRHALVQDAAYGSLLKNDRRQLHQSVGEALERLYPARLDENAALLAYHFEKAAVLEKAVHYLIRAGDHAGAGYANAEAIAFYQAALPQVETLLRQTNEESRRAQLAQLLEKLAEVTERTGQHEAARAYFYRALDLQADDPLISSRLYRRIGVTYTIERHYPEAFQVWEKAESSLGTLTEQSDRALWHAWIELQVERCWAYYWQSALKEMDALCQQVLPLAEKLGTPLQRSRALVVYTLYRFRLERYVVADDVLVYAQKSLAAAQEAGRMDLIYDATFGQGFFHLCRRELAPAEEKLRQAYAYAQQLGDPLRIARGANYLMILARMRGQAAQVADYLPIIFSTTWAGPMADYTAQVKAAQSWLAWRKGDLLATQALGLESLAILHQMPIKFPFYWTTLWPLIAVALTEADLAAARDYAQQLLDPTQILLPADLEQTLKQALQAADEEAAQSKFTEAVALAQSYGYL
jgi:serine/threonine protein kinase/class 3 adenylate cyclase